jgi:DNA repair protein RadB
LTCKDLLEKIPTSCRRIDEFLKGGFPVDSVALVYGEAETGKTTLVMQCAANCARAGYKTLFVDSDRTFSAQRLSQIVPERFKEVPELIILVRPNDFREQTAIGERLGDYINENFKLVVFDTMTSLYRLEIAESPSRTFELNRELNRLVAVLAQAARTQRIVVLLTGQVHSVLNEVPVSIEPVATRVLKFWADAVLEMKLTENPQTIEVTVEKNPAKLPPMTCNLRITKSGIH